MPKHTQWLLAIFCCVILAAMWVRFGTKGPQAVRSVPTNALEMLIAFERQEAEKYWAPELQAENLGRRVEQFWDELNGSSNKLTTAAAFPLGTVTLARYAAAINHPHGIQVRRPLSETNGQGWKELIERAVVDGWQLEQCEFRHNAFDPSTQKSTYYFSAHLFNQWRDQRAILEGDLLVLWRGDAIGTIDARQVEVRTRSGPPVFRKMVDEEIVPKERSYFIDPVIVWDLDRDGSREIILAASNLVFRRGERMPLCAHDPGLIFTGALGDFTSNGTTDFICAKFDGLFLYEGTQDGTFPDQAKQVWTAKPRLKYGQALVTGDVDNDGDLDLFLGQYKVPYEKGQMPRPYFDANDGHPSFLLENDGRGNFTDVTQQAGLGAKRGRRVYNASFIDLDRDRDLDLVVVSDFHGIDGYENDGRGKFKDVTEKWFPERHALGMANGFADFDRDGRLDLLLIGMNSPTADRLKSLKLNRPYALPDEGMRAKVTFGNRLLFGNRDGSFRQRAISHAIARTGWSWGCAVDDLDGDGFPDVYIANGHESRGSVRDYEPEFWLHDIYVGDSTENWLAQDYFRQKMAKTRGQGWSYGGYEKNRLFLNLDGTNFVECAYLMGVALEADSRNVVSDDFDGDGRTDLLVTTFEIHPRMRQTLKVFRNELAQNTNRAERFRSPGSYRSQIQASGIAKPN